MTHPTDRDALERAFVQAAAGVRDLDEPGRALLEHAFRFAADAHEGQQRLSGDPFIMHGIEVARILAGMGLDASAVAAGFLHDVVEDTRIGIHEIEREFGEEIAVLVKGMTKIGQLRFSSPEERQAEAARRMLFSMVRDIRVIFIKLADRLHNMRTLEHLPPDRIRVIARETMEIYAPLARRLGVAQVSSELEDLAFRHLDPATFERVDALVRERAADGDAVVESFRAPVEKQLAAHGIEASITWRIKHTYSVWRKMVSKQVRIDRIDDIIAVRIIVPTVSDCYLALEIVHAVYAPLNERFRDFIASPKGNLYQSLHTTVVDGDGRRIEVQIRTHEMDVVARFGLAAHWRYKEGGASAPGWEKWTELFRRAVDEQLEIDDPGEFLDALKTDLFASEIWVFTPRGELKRLPAGSTPIDFAYAVHSDVGNRCEAARVNGRLVPLDHRLENADRVEILTSPRTRPSGKWLTIVRSSRARQKIRQWLRSRTREQEEAAGRDMLKRECRRRRVALPREEEFERVAGEMGRGDARRLFVDLARGRVSTKDVFDRLFGEAPSPEPPHTDIEELREMVRRPVRGVRLQGIDNLLVSFARCCQPVPGDPIVGIVTRGRGVSVHRSGCPNVEVVREPGRLVEVEWEPVPGRKFLVSLVVNARDREGLVAEISKRVQALGTEVKSGRFEIHGGEFSLVLVVAIDDLGHLRRVVREIEEIDSVLSVTRAV